MNRKNGRVVERDSEKIGAKSYMSSKSSDFSTASSYASMSSVVEV